jgi:hypothetical protein
MFGYKLSKELMRQISSLTDKDYRRLVKGLRQKISSVVLESFSDSKMWNEPKVVPRAPSPLEEVRPPKKEVVETDRFQEFLSKLSTKPGGREFVKNWSKTDQAEKRLIAQNELSTYDAHVESGILDGPDIYPGMAEFAPGTIYPEKFYNRISTDESVDPSVWKDAGDAPPASAKKQEGILLSMIGMVRSDDPDGHMTKELFGVLGERSEEILGTAIHAAEAAKFSREDLIRARKAEFGVSDKVRVRKKSF